MIGKIEATNRSQSGKTMGVQITGKWYTTKNWELEQAVGKNVIFEPSTSEFNGTMMHWLNDYVFEDAQTTPAGQAMSQAMAAQAAPAPQSTISVPNKDSLIGAMALTKACPGPRDQVWENFVFFYNKLQGWDHTVPY